VRNAPGREPRFFLQKWTGLEWARGTSGIDTSILYRADELAKAIGDGLEIIVVEGEKDADNLWRLGFAGTCNAHGASAPGKAPKWKKEHSDQLTGAAVVVLNDHDAPGVAHAQAVCELSIGVAKSVRRLNLADHWPDIPKGGDVSDWLDHGGGTRDKLATLIAGAPAAKHKPATRPTIIIEVGETKRIVDEIEAALLASDLQLYKRGGLIVSPGVSRLPTWNKGKVIAQAIIERPPDRLVEDAEAIAQFLRRNKNGDLVPCDMPKRLALTLKARLLDLKFPVIAAIANTPSISPFGELLDRPGFDPETGVLYDPLEVAFPRVPDLPTESATKAALDRLLLTLHTLDDDFVAPEDKGVALSTLMTSVARRALDFAPLHGVDAPVAGSGKSMVIEIASILATGHGAVVMSQGETREETEKKLGVVLMRGDALIAIDNCDLPLEGEILNQALTQSLLQVRILGRSEMVTVQAWALITATGNNLTPKGDLVRRSIVARLDPKCARPELRQYNFDPIAYAMENRAQLVVDVITLLKAYHNKGCPNRPPELQSFKHWSNTVRGCICWLAEAFPDANLADPIETMERVRSTDPVLAALQTVLAAWRDQFQGDPVTVAKAVKAAEATKIEATMTSAGTFVHDRPLLNPDLRDALLSVAGRGGRIDVRALGNWLAKHVGRAVNMGDGRTLKIAKALTLLNGNLQWEVIERHP
jgi:putative DNA primase/helicase